MTGVPRAVWGNVPIQKPIVDIMSDSCGVIIDVEEPISDDEPVVDDEAAAAQRGRLAAPRRSQLGDEAEEPARQVARLEDIQGPNFVMIPKVGRPPAEPTNEAVKIAWKKKAKDQEAARAFFGQSKKRGVSDTD